MNNPLLSVKTLKVNFKKKIGINSVLEYRAIDGVSLDVQKKEILGIVGESGSGKTTLARAIIGLNKISAGDIFYRGNTISGLNDAQFRKYRHKIQMIFQDPYSSLNPRKRAKDIVMEPMRLLGYGTGAEREAHCYKLLEEVGLRKEQADYYPHGFSGGQRQRLGIARALAIEPELLICDEAVSALDAAIQAQVLNLLKRLIAKGNLTVIFISHDLAVIQFFCEKVAVMYCGKIVEYATREKLYATPQHPYTRKLMRSIPAIGDNPHDEKIPVRFLPPPDLTKPFFGCLYRERCPYAKEICEKEEPSLRHSDNGEHRVACHFPQIGIPWNT